MRLGDLVSQDSWYTVQNFGLDMEFLSVDINDWPTNHSFERFRIGGFKFFFIPITGTAQSYILSTTLGHDGV